METISHLRLSTSSGLVYGKSGMSKVSADSVITKFVNKTVLSNDSHWAWQNYKQVVLALQKEFCCKSLMEVGGGRSPLFDYSEYRNLNTLYTLNDISPKELALAPGWPLKGCFDICSPPSTIESSYDLIFSKMVFEHIPEAAKAYQAVYRLLKPGGIALSFFPTLYCLPFVLNYLSPEKLSSKLQRLFDPRSNPKFPAYYSWCRSTDSLKRNLMTVGFRFVEVSPFYGHAYYRSIPFLRSAERHWTQVARGRNLTIQSSFAYAFVQR
jgi:SAM-dependent methyltransferase